MRSFSKIFFVLLLMYFSFHGQYSYSGRINIPPIVIIAINTSEQQTTFYNPSLGPSKFSYETTISDLAPRRGSENKYDPDYIINGAIYSNCGRTGNCQGNGKLSVEVIPKIIQLTNRGETIELEIDGNIGKKKVDSSGRATNINFEAGSYVSALQWKADIALEGRIDRNTISNVTQPGDYVGVFTLQILIP